MIVGAGRRDVSRTVHGKLTAPSSRRAVRGAARGQRLRYIANGDLVMSVAINEDPFVHEFDADQRRGAGPLGTLWRVETRDLRSRTTIGNPVFLLSPE